MVNVEDRADEPQEQRGISELSDRLERLERQVAQLCELLVNGKAKTPTGKEVRSNFYRADENSALRARQGKAARKAGMTLADFIAAYPTLDHWPPKND